MILGVISQMFCFFSMYPVDNNFCSLKKLKNSIQMFLVRFLHWLKKPNVLSQNNIGTLNFRKPHKLILHKRVDAFIDNIIK